MKLLLFSICLLLFVSCKTEPDLSTPEKFGVELVKSIHDRDPSALFALYMTMDDIDVLLSEFPKAKRFLTMQKNSGNKTIEKAKRRSYERLTAISLPLRCEYSPSFQIKTSEFGPEIQDMKLHLISREGPGQVITVSHLIKIDGQWKCVNDIYPD